MGETHAARIALPPHSRRNQPGTGEDGRNDPHPARREPVVRHRPHLPQTDTDQGHPRQHSARAGLPESGRPRTVRDKSVRPACGGHPAAVGERRNPHRVVPRPGARYRNSGPGRHAHPPLLRVRRLFPGVVRYPEKDEGPRGGSREGARGPAARAHPPGGPYPGATVLPPPRTRGGHPRGVPKGRGAGHCDSEGETSPVHEAVQAPRQPRGHPLQKDIQPAGAGGAGEGRQALPARGRQHSPQGHPHQRG